MPKAPPGFSGGKLPDRSQVESGEKRRTARRRRWRLIRGIVAVVRAKEGCHSWRWCHLEYCIIGGQRFKQKWDCNVLDWWAEEKEWHQEIHCTFSYMHTTLHGSRRATQRVSSMMCAEAFVVCLFVFVLLLILSVVLPSMMSHVWTCICCFFVFVSFLFLTHFFLFSFTVHLLWRALPLQCLQLRETKQWGVLHRGDIQSSHRLRAQAPRRLPLLRDFCDDLPARIRRRRYGALVLGWCRTRRLACRKIDIFTTTVHSGARESVNLRQTYHSHEESLLPAQSFFTHKNGETRTRT